MKKVILAAIVIAGGWFVYKRLQAGRAEENLWAEATDPITPASH